MNVKINGTTSAPGIPQDAEVFRFSLGSTWLPLIAMLTTLAEATLLFAQAWNTADPTTRLTQIPEGIFYVLLVELNFRLLRRSFVRVAVNSEGIWQRRGRSTVFIAWNDLADVRANDAQQLLELTDVRKVVSISVGYQIGNFERLRAYILSRHSAQTQRKHPGTSVFHHSLGNQIVYAIVAVLLFFSAWHMQHNLGFPFSLCLVAGVLMVFLVLREPTTLTVGHDGITLQYLIFQSDIAFSSIAAVDFRDVRYRGNVWAGVRITMHRGARIRLSRFREGSLAIYEALQEARKAATPTLDAALSPSIAPPLDASIAPPLSISTRRTHPLALRSVGFAFVAIVVALLGMFGGLGHTRVGKALSEAMADRTQTAPYYPPHRGPIAQPNQLQGSGTVYLVQMGSHTQSYSLADFAHWLHDKYEIDVQVLPAMAIDPSAWDAGRHQFVAEQLYAQLKQDHPDLALNSNAFLIGFTDADMYSVNQMWSSSFTQRDGLRAAVISSDGMGDTLWQRAHLPASAAIDRFRDRMRRILLKDVAILYWHLPLSNDPTSLLHNPLDPDIPTEDIYQSDLDPALNRAGLTVDEPCVYFTYSDKSGMALLPGSVVRGCGDIQNPMQDESVEVFEVDLRLGLLIDKHTDLYLPDTIPIEFQRVTRDGGYGDEPFGISGSDNYDQLLGSADNIHVSVESADYQVDLIRAPEWLSVLPLIKYVGGDRERAWIPSVHGGAYQTVWQYQLAWHALPYEHYDLHRFNGDTKTFLPCGDAPGLDCTLVDVHDSQGRELKIDRDTLRRLVRITSPSGSWVSVGTESDRRIRAVYDSRGRTVLYGYDQARNLTSVTYPSGEVYRYTYGNEQHILAVSVGADASSEPHIVLRNQYQDKMITKMTLPGDSVFTFDYNSTDGLKVNQAIIHTPDGRLFNVGIGDNWATVRETATPSSAVHN